MILLKLPNIKLVGENRVMRHSLYNKNTQSFQEINKFHGNYFIKTATHLQLNNPHI